MGTSTSALRDAWVTPALPWGPCSPPQRPEPLPLLLSPQVLRRYDVVLVQEVRDSDLSAVTELMEQLNRYQQGRGWGHPAAKCWR